ncbi:hypothetical protein OA167_02950 [Pelagibacteraceae bacterium]|nr:hypothetical protein [Pelagibacteraceae bacterium]
MRLDPISILLNKDFDLKKKFYFVSGNEVSLIEKITSIIVKKYKEDENASTTNIDSTVDFLEEDGLFENKKIYLIRNFKGVDEKFLIKIKDTNNVFVFVHENSQKIKKIKNIFLKDNNSFLVDCYELDKSAKIKILNEFIKFSKINLDQSLYWFLVEKLDNKYAFLENSLDKILETDKQDINLSNIKKILTINDLGKEKVFFNLLKSNKEIVNIYREKIQTASDVNEFYYYCKFFCQLIIDSVDERDYNKKIPVYLFKEKNFLVDVFRRFNSRKKKMLLKLLSSTEKSLRKEGGLSLIYGLRFFLNIKKITTS